MKRKIPFRVFQSLFKMILVHLEIFRLKWCNIQWKSGKKKSNKSMFHLFDSQYGGSWPQSQRSKIEVIGYFSVSSEVSGFNKWLKDCCFMVIVTWGGVGIWQGCLLEMCPTGRDPPGRPGACWRHNLFHLAQEILGVPEELQAMMEEAWTSFLSC